MALLQRGGKGHSVISIERKAIDNVVYRKVLRNLKYEYIYLNPVEDDLECPQDLEQYFTFYNHKDKEAQIPSMMKFL